MRKAYLHLSRQASIGSAPANGNYDFEFKLFDTAASNGAQQVNGSTLQRQRRRRSLQRIADFGACQLFQWSGQFWRSASRQRRVYDIGPRQPINSTPYALKSAKRGRRWLVGGMWSCITGSQVQSVQGSR
jgi:hypothetical protein